MLLDVPAPSAVLADLHGAIHKALRAELFAATVAAGRCDAGSPGARAALVEQVAGAVALVEGHAATETEQLAAVLRGVRVDLADRVADEHRELSLAAAALVDAATSLRQPAADHARTVHHLHLDLASFTAADLLHQELEERAVRPLVYATLGPEGIAAVRRRNVAALAAPEQAPLLAAVLAAANPAERAALLTDLRDLDVAPPTRTTPA